MELVPLGDVALTYGSLLSLDYANGGQLYGTMEGTISGDRLSGNLALTNLALRRPDGVNMPTLRGVLTTVGDARVWVELDGIAILRQADQARVFVTGARFRSTTESFRWLDTVVGLLEGILDSVGVGGQARGRLYECRASIT